MAGTSKQWREQVRVVQSEQDASSPGVAILGHLVLSVGRLRAYGPSTGATTESKRLVSEPPIGWTLLGIDTHTNLVPKLTSAR